jgi:Saxitoxin biosynthesis operon protein SxtJ
MNWIKKMIEELKNIKSEKSDLRKFGITVGVILMIIAGFLFWKEKESFQLFLAIGIILFLAGIAIPIVLKPVYWIWMIFATLLGWFMTHMILTLLFYVIFTSTGLIARMFGKQFLALRREESKESYWNYRQTKQTVRENYEKQF